ncbi:hypothetical protein V495_00597 [Pseudogymnoascus sp. VKM F-4514 (FW-929)]|nr:hypothetical protein V495_00597 [Pseudogymnoascus sp. VKM F-4514 (FW-929)]KFY66021.1 hypothetical protein V497_01127 [Pseudogymnoascus sp. VKM F-4516 (FW-969)]
MANSIYKNDTNEKSDHAAVLAEENENVPAPIVTSEDEEKATLRKIDLHLMPLMFVTYALQYLDKTTVGNANVLGMAVDTNLVGQQFSWVSSVFYFGYLGASIPASYGFVKLPLGKYLAGTILLWSIVLACHGATTNFAGLVVLRLLLGAFESVVSPGFSLITSIWYKPSEHAWRHGIWFAGNGVANMFGGLLAYAIGRIGNSLAPWRLLFIIFGSITFGWGLVMLFYLPDTALKAKWLTPHERDIAHSRPQTATHNLQTSRWMFNQAIEALKDPKTWLLFGYTAFTSIPNGGFTNFSGLIIKGFGNDRLHTLLLTMPQGVCQVAFTLVSSYLASKIRKSRCLLITILLCISILGWCMVGYLPINQTAGKLGGVYIFGAYAAGFPLSLSIIASDVAGYTKKTVVSAMLFLAYCAGNIAGPQVFLEREAPQYKTGCTVCIVCLCLGICCILALRQYMDWENKRRDRELGTVIEAEPKLILGLKDGVTELPAVGIDETDWEQRRFRHGIIGLNQKNCSNLFIHYFIIRGWAVLFAKEYIRSWVGTYVLFCRQEFVKQIARALVFSAYVPPGRSPNAAI